MGSSGTPLEAGQHRSPKSGRLVNQIDGFLAQRVGRRDDSRIRLVAALQDNQVSELLRNIDGGGFYGAALYVAATACIGHPDGRRRGERARLVVVVSDRKSTRLNYSHLGI